MIGLWKDKDPMIAELHKARMVLALRSEDDHETYNANLRLYEAIEVIEKCLRTALDGENPYWRLYLREYDAHLVTKERMSASNGEMQVKLKLAEDKFTEAIGLLALEKMRVDELRRVLGDKLNEVRAK